MILLNEKKVNEIVIKTIKELIQDDVLINDLFTVLSDTNLYSHSIAVARYATAIGVEYGFSDKRLLGLARGSLLHDIGKKFIDNAILYKPASFTNAEFEIVKQHTSLGYNYMLDRTDDNFILKAVHSHHENIQGTGYPIGMDVNDLDIEIITVADIFSALTEARVYKKAMSAKKAFEILQGNDGVVQEVVSKLQDIVFDEYAFFFNTRRWAKYFREWLPVRSQQRYVPEFD